MTPLARLSIVTTCPTPPPSLDNPNPLDPSAPPLPFTSHRHPLLPPTLFLYTATLTSPAVLPVSNPPASHDTRDVLHAHLRLLGLNLSEPDLPPEQCPPDQTILLRTRYYNAPHESFELHQTHFLNEEPLDLFNNRPVFYTSPQGAPRLDDYYNQLLRMHAFFNLHFLAVSTSRTHWQTIYNRLTFEELETFDLSLFQYNPTTYCEP